MGFFTERQMPGNLQNRRSRASSEQGAPLPPAACHLPPAACCLPACVLPMLRPPLNCHPRGLLQDVSEYWEQVLSSVDKTTARALLPHLDVQQVGSSSHLLPSRREPSHLTFTAAVHDCSCFECHGASAPLLQVLGLPAAPETEAAPPTSIAAAAIGGSSSLDEVGSGGTRPGSGRGRRGRPPLYNYFATVKKQYGKSVVLVRVSADAQPQRQRQQQLWETVHAGGHAMDALRLE